MRDVVMRGLKTGAVMTAATAGAMFVAASLKRGTPWSGMNAMATAIGIGGRDVKHGFDRAASPAGVGVLTAGLLAWGVAYEAALAATRRRGSLVTGALSALGGYAVDRWVLPPWLVPNFRRALGPLGAVAKYTALGVASAVAAR